MNTITELEMTVSALYGIKVSDLAGHSRPTNMVHARFIIWRVLYDVLKWGSPSIGARYNRDHTTILYGLRQARESKNISEEYDAFMKIYSDRLNKKSPRVAATSFVDNQRGTYGLPSRVK